MMINHIMCTSKILTDLCSTKPEIKTKNGSVKVIYSVLVVLLIKMCWSAKLEKATIEFENYSKQMPVLFKIYSDFECNLRGVESYEGSYTKQCQDHFPCSFVANCCL